jgi:hypothetical protein
VDGICIWRASVAQWYLSQERAAEGAGLNARGHRQRIKVAVPVEDVLYLRGFVLAYYPIA